MKRTQNWMLVGLFAVALLLPVNTGCDDALRTTARILDDVSDGLWDLARDYDDDDDSIRDWLDDVIDDVEDWFD